MPEKKCGDCGLSVHVRRRECDCGYVFPMAKKSKRKARDTQVDPNTVDYVFDGWKKASETWDGLTDLIRGNRAE